MIPPLRLSLALAAAGVCAVAATGCTPAGDISAQGDTTTAAAATESAPTNEAIPATPSAEQAEGGGIALGGDELPPGWPADLPAYTGGRLVSAVVTDDGLNINAVWGTAASPEEAWADMDARLRAAGFLPSGESGGEDMRLADDSMTSDVYTRGSLEANLIVVSGDETSVLLNASQL